MTEYAGQLRRHVRGVRIDVDALSENQDGIEYDATRIRLERGAGVSHGEVDVLTVLSALFPHATIEILPAGGDLDDGD